MAFKDGVEYAKGIQVSWKHDGRGATAVAMALEY
jgi:hypothetical protein